MSFDELTSREMRAVQPYAIETLNLMLTTPISQANLLQISKSAATPKQSKSKKLTLFKAMNKAPEALAHLSSLAPRRPASVGETPKVFGIPLSQVSDKWFS